MIRLLSRPMLIVLALLLAPAGAWAKTNDVVAYVPNWANLKTFADTTDYRKLAHIDTASENPRNNQEDCSFSPQDKFHIGKAHAKAALQSPVGPQCRGIQPRCGIGFPRSSIPFNWTGQ